LRGGAGLDEERTIKVLDALAEMCSPITPSPQDLRRACDLAKEHDLTLYEAAYAAVAQCRDARLVTLDGQLLESGLGQRPAELVAALDDPPASR
jgi:predicted nucleic acid-binding protein